MPSVFPRWKIILSAFVVCFSFLIALSNFIPVSDKYKSYTKQLNYGLDLQGGVQLLLKVDFPQYLKDLLSSNAELIKRGLKKERVYFSRLDVSDTQISFDLNSKDAFGDAKKIIQKINQSLDVAIENSRVTIRISESGQSELMRSVLEQTREIIRQRVDESGTIEPSIQIQGGDSVVLQVPGVYDPELLKARIATIAKLTFNLVEDVVTKRDGLSKRTSPNTEIVPGQHDKDAFYVIEKRSSLTGEMLLNAKIANKDGESVVAFSFDNTGAKILADITKHNQGRRLAIVLDKKVVSAPSINDPIIDGSGIITGNFDVQSASELALLLRSGSLPAPIKVVEEKVVGPSLGQDSIRLGKVASLVGTLAIIVFMIAVYGLNGLFASIALTVNLILIIAVMAVIGATLTLPGIAGIVLTMGMAVDTNVLIFERIREELRGNTSKFSTTGYAIERGFKNAFATILDSNLTTLIAAFFLYTFGSGMIKGFAVALTVGILASMFTAITLTKFLIISWNGK